MKSGQISRRIQAVAKLHIVYALVLAAATIAFDAWHLITPTTVIERWVLAATIGIVAAIVWYAAKVQVKSILYYNFLIYGLIAADVFVASMSVYAQRGIASKAVLLYIIPLFVAAVLKSRSALIATSIVCVSAYAATCVRYFYENPGQAYKIELYGEILQQGGLLIVIALLLWAVLFNSQKA